MIIRSLSALCVATLLLCTSSSAGVIRYDLNTNTTNADSAVLVEGFFETDGTTGTALRLSDILTDFSITISEIGRIETLTPLNSTVTETLSLFDVTPNQISLPAGPAFFRGLRINTVLTAQADKDIRYVAFQTNGTANVFVSINSGTVGLNGTAETAIIGTSNVPEPSSASLFFSLACIGVMVRRKRHAHS